MRPKRIRLLKRALTGAADKFFEPRAVLAAHGLQILLVLDQDAERVADDCWIQLGSIERDEVVANCDHLRSLKFSPNLPLVFTEYGAIMAANVLNSARAEEVSVQVVRAFASLRSFVTTHRELARKVAALERRYDGQFKVVFDALRVLLREHEKPPMGSSERGGHNL